MRVFAEVTCFISFYITSLSHSIAVICTYIHSETRKNNLKAEEGFELSLQSCFSISSLVHTSPLQLNK